MTAFPGEESSPGRLPLSAVVIARNEAARIGECLESLRFADEIVVVDSGSSDGTREIARRYTDKVFDVPWKGFGPQKQAAVELASHDIVLNVDCDERVTPELAEEIGEILSGPAMAAGIHRPAPDVPGREGDPALRVVPRPDDPSLRPHPGALLGRPGPRAGGGFRRNGAA